MTEMRWPVIGSSYDISAIAPGTPSQRNTLPIPHRVLNLMRPHVRSQNGSMTGSSDGDGTVTEPGTGTEASPVSVPGTVSVPSPLRLRLRVSESLIAHPYRVYLGKRNRNLSNTS